MNEPQELRDRLCERLEQIRRGEHGPYLEISAFDAIVAVLQVMLCDHQFETQRNPNTPDGPGDIVVSCKHCGVEL
jgi:hypothetical protein